MKWQVARHGARDALGRAVTAPAPAPIERFPRRAASKRRTRARIVDAARKLFAELGYDDATMAAIAERADVHVTTLFTHFRSKRELTEALAEAALAWLDEAVAAHRARGIPPLVFWRDLVLRASDAYARDAHSLMQGRALLAEPELLPAWLRYERRQIALMEEYIAAYLNVDPARDRRPRMAAAMLIGGGILAYDAWTTSGRRLDLRAENMSLLEAAHALLAPLFDDSIGVDA